MGKTGFAANYALEPAESVRGVLPVDLDFVNPCFPPPRGIRSNPAARKRAKLACNVVWREMEGPHRAGGGFFQH